MPTERYDNKADWLGGRRKGIGGSDAATLAGYGSTKSSTRSRVFLSKVMPPDDENRSAIMVMGSHSEVAHVSLLTGELGMVINANRPYDIQVHAEHEWMRCTLDGWVYEGPRPPSGDKPAAILELKNFANRDEKGLPFVEFGSVRVVNGTTTEWDDEPANEWERQARRAWFSAYLQCQWNMLVTGLDRAILSVWARTSVYVYDVWADVDDQQMLFKVASAFWHEHVLTEDPPPVTPEDSGVGVASKLWAPHDSVVELSEEKDWAALYAAHVTLKKEAAGLKGGADGIKEMLKRELKGAKGGTQKGVRYYVNGSGVMSRRKES